MKTSFDKSSDEDEIFTTKKTQLPKPLFTSHKKSKLKLSKKESNTKPSNKNKQINLLSVDRDSDTDEAAAKRQAQEFPLPTDLYCPSQLKWHKMCIGGGSPIYRPCRIVHNSSALSCLSDNCGSSDEEEEALIEYIQYPIDNDGPSQFTVSKKRLIPYYGKSLSYCEKKTWCKEFITIYENQRKDIGKKKQGKKFNQSNLRAEILFLDRMLKTAKERAGKKDDCSSDEDQSDRDGGEMEEPYTQALTDLDNSDEEVERFFRNNKTSITQKKEPIRPGDVLEYCSLIFVNGDSRGKRYATVLSVDPKRSPIVVLDNGEFIPADTEVKRVKIMREGCLVDHPGVYRHLEDFKLRKLGPLGVNGGGAAAGLRKETERVGGIVKRNMEKFRSKAQAEGYAPIDILNKYKGIDTKSKKQDKNDWKYMREIRPVKKLQTEREEYYVCSSAKIGDSFSSDESLSDNIRQINNKSKEKLASTSVNGIKHKFVCEPRSILPRCRKAMIYSPVLLDNASCSDEDLERLHHSNARFEKSLAMPADESNHFSASSNSSHYWSPTDGYIRDTIHKGNRVDYRQWSQSSDNSSDSQRSEQSGIQLFRTENHEGIESTLSCKRDRQDHSRQKNRKQKQLLSKENHSRNKRLITTLSSQSYISPHKSAERKKGRSRDSSCEEDVFVQNTTKRNVSSKTSKRSENNRVEIRMKKEKKQNLSSPERTYLYKTPLKFRRAI